MCRRSVTQLSITMSRQKLWDGRKTYKDYCAGYRQKRDDHFMDNDAARKRAGKAKKKLFEPEKYEFKKKGVSYQEVSFEEKVDNRNATQRIYNSH